MSLPTLAPAPAMSQDAQQQQQQQELGSKGQLNGPSYQNPSGPLPFPSQIVESLQSGTDIADWHIEPDSRYIQVPGTREREKGWTNHDWFVAYDADGRTYQAFDPGVLTIKRLAYDIPNDGEEQDRQDFQHATYELLLEGKLALAPVESPKFVVDIGTGTGIWAIEFAEKHPDCQVVGTDLSFIQAAPRTSNCHFFVENSETQDWIFPFPMDYVHLRSMGPCFTDIRTVFRRALNHMRPGGWIEIQDGVWELFSIDGSHRGSAMEHWLGLVKDGAARQGRDMSKVRKNRAYLEEVGFANVRDRYVPTPTSPWPRDGRLKKIGCYMGTTMLGTLSPYKRMLALAGLDASEIDDLVGEVSRELHDVRRHCYMAAYFVWAQKPLDAPVIIQQPAGEESTV